MTDEQIEALQANVTSLQVQYDALRAHVIRYGEEALFISQRLTEARVALLKAQRAKYLTTANPPIVPMPPDHALDDSAEAIITKPVNL